MSNCITNNHSKLKYISISQIINYNMSKKINHKQLISLFIWDLKGILVKCHLIKQIKRVPYVEH